MRIVVLGDTHFGVRGNSEQFHENMELFFSNIFFPYLKNNEFDHIIHLGDVFHDRRKIDVKTASLAREYFFEPLKNILDYKSSHCSFICGNHDIYYRDSLGVNSLHEFVESQFSDFTERVNIITKPTSLYGHLLLPWITKYNRDEVIQSISQHSKYCFAHLELNGFNFSKTQIATHGDDPKGFSNFKGVYTGHYHYKHSKGNIHYVGSASQHTWIDAETKRGFHILDDESGEVEFIENPYNIFENINLQNLLDFEIKGDHKRYFRLHIKDNNESLINDVLPILEDIAYDIQIIQNKESQTKVESEVIENIEDTPTFIRGFVENSKVAETLVDYYNKAIQL